MPRRQPYKKITHARRINIIYDFVLHSKGLRELVKQEELSYNTVRNIVESYTEFGRTNKKSFLRSSKAQRALKERSVKQKQMKVSKARAPVVLHDPRASQMSSLIAHQKNETGTDLIARVLSESSSSGSTPKIFESQQTLLPPLGLPFTCTSRGTTHPTTAETGANQTSLAPLSQLQPQRPQLFVEHHPFDNCADSHRSAPQNPPLQIPAIRTQKASVEQELTTPTGRDAFNLSLATPEVGAADTELIPTHILQYETEAECVFKIFTGPLAALNDVALSASPTLRHCKPTEVAKLTTGLSPKSSQ